MKNDFPLRLVVSGTLSFSSSISKTPVLQKYKYKFNKDTYMIIFGHALLISFRESNRAIGQQQELA